MGWEAARENKVVEGREGKSPGGSSRLSWPAFQLGLFGLRSLQVQGCLFFSFFSVTKLTLDDVPWLRKRPAHFNCPSELMFLFSEYLFLRLFLRESQEHEVYLGREDCLDKR